MTATEAGAEDSVMGRHFTGSGGDYCAGTGIALTGVRCHTVNEA